MMLRTTTILVFTLYLMLEARGFVLAPGGHCPDTWLYLNTTSGGRCYHLIQSNFNWDHGGFECNNFGGYLATIRSQMEQSFMIQYIRDSIGSTPTDVWFGASDRGEEGHFQWHTAPHNVQFSDWGHGEPNDQGGIENCLNIRSQLGYRWNDEHCEYKSYVMCEMISI